MNIHKNARLTPVRREEMACSVLTDALTQTGLGQHAALLAHAKATWGLGHGAANALVLLARRGTDADPAAAEAAAQDPLGQLYSGKTAALRAVHDAVMAVITPLGPFEVAAKKGYVALRRRKQFAMLGPKGTARIELGINLKDPLDDPRAKAQPPGGMCQYTISLSDPAEVDAALAAILASAFAAAG